MRPVIFYRASEMMPEELDAALAAGFHCVDSRMGITHDDLVIGRYSVLPFYKELARDIEYVGARMANSTRQHNYIADLRNWAEDLKELTPKTWYRLEDVSDNGPFVLKGKTNSRKDRWSTHMYAATYRDAVRVYENLLRDGLIGQDGDKGQDIYVREYVPLVTYAHGISGLPITKEFRFFFYRGEILSGAYYWSSFEDTCLDQDPNWKAPDIKEVPPEFLSEVSHRIGDNAPFVVIDVAEDTTGRWWVVDVNDGQMSGLSGNKPDVLYPSLYRALTT
jgi:hypothetical protein